MARLKTLRPLVSTIKGVSTIKPLVGRAPGDEQGRNRYRDETQHYRQWYKTARWQKLRMQVLIRDNYTCQRTGTLCIGKHPAPNSPVADHRIPHKGCPRLFWDINNIETVSKEYHDSLKQRAEKSGELAAARSQ